MISCYRPIHSITTQQEIKSYPINSDESKAFIDMQYNEFETGQDVKACLDRRKEITDKVSISHQQMYE